MQITTHWSSLNSIPNYARGRVDKANPTITIDYSLTATSTPGTTRPTTAQEKSGRTQFQKTEE